MVQKYLTPRLTQSRSALYIDSQMSLLQEITKTDKILSTINYDNPSQKVPKDPSYSLRTIQPETKQPQEPKGRKIVFGGLSKPVKITK